MTSSDQQPPPDEEGVEVLEADHVYILMRREYRISRNVRAEWYLRRINSIITFPRREKLSDNEEELEVVSVLPMDVPPEWDSDTSHLYHYRVTQRTTLHFLARKYRLVFCLDLSPSTSVVDVTKSSTVLDEVFTTLRQCLKGIVRPFYIPGSLLLFRPEIYLTIIAHTPFFKSQSQQVLVQGWLLMERNLDHFLNSIQASLIQLEAQLAQATAQTYGQMVEDNFLQALSLALPNPMVSPDIGFVDMLRYGIVALQLLPENSSAGIVIITDGVIGLPDATVFDSLLVQLRNQTIACSFLQLGSVYQPQRSFGYIPFTDLMNFLATATCGAYMPSLPSVGNDYEYDMNDYHKSLLAWGFQKFTHDLCSSDGDHDHDENECLSVLPLAPEVTELIRKKERETQLNTSLNAILSCRLREGYAIKQVAIAADQIQLVLVLPWKYSIFIEYHIRSPWPPTQHFVYTEVWIEATYEFLNDVTSDPHRQFRSKYRQSMVNKYLHTLQHLRDTDTLLVGLQSFSASPTYYTLPDCIKSGHPVFYRNPGHPHSIHDANSEQFPQFTNFWRPVCMLDTNIWQKWMHTHRIGVILEHDHPLPKNLHITSTSGRYGFVHCRQAESALTTQLADWCDFVLIENDSYIKFLYREEEQDKQAPISFFVVRITSKPPPCLVIRLAFLGGTPGHIRNQMVRIIKRKIQELAFPQRGAITERSKSLPPAGNQTEDKLSEDMTISASSDLQPTGVRRGLSRMASNVPCCVITHKPVEKILIWYDKIPTNLLSPLALETPPGVTATGRSGYTKMAPTKSATHNMALLSRYLHHRRWIWAVQPPNAPAVSLTAVSRILNTLTRMRLQEGFNFAHSCNGIITMVREFAMKLDLCEDEGKDLLEGGLATFPCVAQYVLFPPHITNSSRDSVVEDDWEEGDSVEADGVMEIVTECWVEPQNGVVVSPSPRANHLNNCSYRQLAQAFYPVDQKCIWSMMTVEHLLQMCHGGGGGGGGGGIGHGGVGGGGPEPPHPEPPPALDEAAADPSQRIQQVPFSLDLIHLLPMCQQAELLVSTFVQDLMSSLVKRVTFHCDNTVDEANQTLYNLLLMHLKQLHHGCEYTLSTADLLALPGVLQERPRPPESPVSPFSNTNIGKTDDPPKWRCFLKGVSSNHLLFTLLPASYHDLKLLLVKRANITDSENLALKLVPGGGDLQDIDTETNTTDQPAGGPLSEQHISFESSTSSLTHMTSPSLPPTTPTSIQPAPTEDHTPARMRYKSGPAPHTGSQVVPTVYADSHVRERASSFHVSQERCNFFGQGASAAERNRTGSVDSPTKEPQAVLPKTTSPNEHIRKRYISMPSKSFGGVFTAASKSMSSEGLRSEEGCVPLQVQPPAEPTEGPAEHRISSLDDSSSAGPPASHRPLLGTVTLPIYSYDCKLSSVTTQLINSEDRDAVVGKDLYLDSTSKLDLQEDTVPLKGGSGPSATPSPSPSASTSQENGKQGNGEPRSEESDAGDGSCLFNHMKALEVAYLRSFVLAVFQGLQKELDVHQNDIQAALDHCNEAVMEIEITNFLQAICGHLRDFRLRLDLEHLRQRQPNPTSQSTPLAKFQKAKTEGTDTPPAANNTSTCTTTNTTTCTSTTSTTTTSTSTTNTTSSSKFPLSLLKRHHPCRDLQQLHTSIRERFNAILLGSFQIVPAFPEFYYFCPRSLHHSSEGTPVEDFVYVSSRELELLEKNQIDPARLHKPRRVSVGKKSDVFTEGEEDLDDETTVNGGEEEEEEDEGEDDDPDRSIEFRSEIGSTVFQRLHSQLTVPELDEDKTSVISEQDEDMSSLPDTVPPLFLHLTCTIRIGGHVHATISLKNLPTCLDEVVHTLTYPELDLATVRITLDVLCMTLLPALAASTTKMVAEVKDSAVDLSRSFRTISMCSTASPPQLKRGRSISESTCASLSDIDESFLEDEDQLIHLPDFQHQAILTTVDEIKWLLRDEIASAMLHTCHLKEANLEMVVAHVESSRNAPNCILESIPLNFVCGMEQSKERFMQEFGRLSVTGHHLRQEGALYYLVQEKSQIRRRHFSSVVPPLTFHSQSINFRPHPHADDSAQLRQMDTSCQEAKVSLSSPDTIRCPASRFQAGRVSFDTERRASENLGDMEGGVTQKGEGPEKEKWMRRRERKERRDSERRGSINTSDSDSDIQLLRGPFSRESSHQPHDPRQRYSESPKKSSSLAAAKRASKEQMLGETKDKEDKNGKKEDNEENKDEDESNNTTPRRQLLAPSRQLQESQKGSSDHSQNSEPHETSTKDQETGEETQQQVADSEDLCGTSPAQNEKVKENANKGAKNGEKGDLHPTNGDSHASPRLIEGGSVTEGRVEGEEVVRGEGTTPTDARVPKDPSHRLSLPLNELIRCGSESLPRPQASAEVIRKSASTDSFVPSVTEAAVDTLRTPPTATLTASTSGGLWAEFMKSRHNSSDVLKSRNSSGTSTDLLKSRHNSGTGGDLLKSRHNSGTGSVLGGPYSDVSSLLESGQTTEDGCEGDISDSDNDCSDWLQDFELVEPFLPEFWLILRVSVERVDTFFHCRTEAELGRWRNVQADVVRNVRALVKLVNQTLLLQDLHNTRMCNPLLEPETSEEIWLKEDTKSRSVYDSEPEYRAILEASFKFKPGAFACRAVWETKFELHHKVCTGKVGSKGILALRTILNPFSVNNRKNMFVYEDKSGNGSHVFYVRLKEQQSSSVSPQVDGRSREEAGLPHSASVSSLVKRSSREDDPQVAKTELRPRVSSFGEKDVIMEGVPSTPAQRRRSHYIVLTVHGIAEPGPAIKEELVRMLQNRLDEAVVEAICLMLWNNPQQKLTLEDVHFIQPPYQPPKTIIRFTVNASALPHLQAVGFYLRQNMLSCGFIHPKYADSCPEHHFQDFSATDQDLSSEPNIFLFVRPRKSAAKGIACIALSLVDGSGYPIQHMSCARPAQMAYQQIFSRQDFDALTHIQEYQPSPTKSPGPMAMLQFKVWESGRVDLAEVKRYLVDSMRHALWDINMEYCLLTAPIMPSMSTPQHPTPASEPTTPKKEVRGLALRSVSLLENSGSSSVSQRSEDRTRSVSVSGVPPHVCLPRMASRLGSKRMARTNESRGDGQQERSPSPLTLVQARLRLMSNSVPDLKVRGRRASLHYPWDGTPLLEGAAGHPKQGHSPLKVRHSVDLGVDRSKLLGTEGTTVGQELWEYPGSSSSMLHPLYHTTMLDWLEFASVLEERGEHTLRRELGEKSGEHAVKKHIVNLGSKHAVPIFLTELQKWLSQNATDTSTKIFEETYGEEEEEEVRSTPVYKLVESSKVPQVLRSDPSGGYTHTNFIIIGRNNQQWWATLFEENFNDYYISMITSSKSSQRYPPLVVSPRGRCLIGGEITYPRPDNSSVSSTTAPPPSSSTSMPITPFTTTAGGTVSSSLSSANIPISPPVTVPSTPTSTSNIASSLWATGEMSDILFVPRQKLILATLRGLELVIYTYNWTKEQCDNLHSTMTRLTHWTTARNRLLSTIVLQKMGLYHNQPFTRKTPGKKEEDNNPYMGNQSHVDNLIKLQAPARESSGTTDRTSRRLQGMVPVLSLTDVRESRPPRPPHSLHHPNLKDLELRHGTQMSEMRRLVVQKETQRKVLLKMVLETRGHSSPMFSDKILSLYKQNARIVHFCLTPLLFLPRWRWQVAATRDHTLVSPSSPTDKTYGTKTPEPRSRHDSGNSMKSGVGGIGPSGLRRSFSLKSSATVAASPNQQRRRHVTGGGDEKWHDALCSSYLKEYIQYLQSLGFLTLNITQAAQQRGSRLSRGESESRGYRVKEVRFNEQVTKEPTYLLKNVLGGTILLEIAFSEPYFSCKIYVLESCRLEGKKLSSQMEGVAEVKPGGPLSSPLSPTTPLFPEGCPPDQIEDKFAINSFLDKVDDIKVLLHLHSFTYDFHLRALCAYVADRQLLFAPGYHLSSCLSDFIKYYNKGPNFARNLIHSGALTIEETGTPGEQLYNYLLAREKQYKMRVLRMTPVILDPDAVMHNTEFILVHTKTCRVHYRDGNDQRVSDDYDVTLLVSHNTSANTLLHHLHLNFYVILTSTREVYPNRILEKKMGHFRTVSIAPSLGRRYTPSSTQTDSCDHSGSDTPPVTGSTTTTTAEEASDNSPAAQENLPSSVKSFAGIRSESVNYLGYYTQYEETMQRTLESQAEEARARIQHIFNQAKIHCRRDSLWQRLTASLREEERKNLPREQVLGGLSFTELSELLDLVRVEHLGSVDSQLLPLLSKPLHWYQGLIRVLQSKYQERHRSLISSDGNVQHVVVLSSSCPDAFMMLSINLHLQKAELCCVNKQLKGEGTSPGSDHRVQTLIQDFVNACCFHLWSGLL
ncbi:KICSTOR complex protein SZT2-like isoform X17 [Eriocheir sinensis]|uniref:KICSTOR complex protein SZT2-like isoform X17 n=1 Tax=Eriocheir sinensis TaxID=95602 RepID=UPI0021CAD8B1|nr:KICSTOR complex protein SZT2-like isoform X17 [Eriocheir sinensis]